jgi:molybdate transport system substrate-binding protein
VPDVNQELLAKDKIEPGQVDIASIPVGLGVRGSAQGLDVSTPEGVKAALLGAASVKYARTGPLVPTVQTMFATLGVTTKIKDTSASHETAALAPGEYEIAIFPLSEIIANKALKSLGPVIAPFQTRVVIAAAVSKDAAHEAEARALIQFMQGPAMAAAFAANGIEPAPASER